MLNTNLKKVLFSVAIMGLFTGLCLAETDTTDSTEESTSKTTKHKRCTCCQCSEDSSEGCGCNMGKMGKSFKDPFSEDASGTTEIQEGNFPPPPPNGERPPRGGRHGFGRPPMRGENASGTTDMGDDGEFAPPEFDDENASGTTNMGKMKRPPRPGKHGKKQNTDSESTSESTTEETAE